MLSTFQASLPFGTPPSHPFSPASTRVFTPTPTHSSPPALAFPYTGASNTLKAQGPLLPLITKKAILCHICCQSHGSLHVHSLVGGPVLRSSRGRGKSGWLTLLLPPWGCKFLKTIYLKYVTCLTLEANIKLCKAIQSIRSLLCYFEILVDSDFSRFPMPSTKFCLVSLLLFRQHCHPK
jgi:hypothetical protein